MYCTTLYKQVYDMLGALAQIDETQRRPDYQNNQIASLVLMEFKALIMSKFNKFVAEQVSSRNFNLKRHFSLHISISWEFLLRQLQA
jgi:hypothetical protein